VSAANKVNTEIQRCVRICFRPVSGSVLIACGNVLCTARAARRPVRE
jgi:hypothetical protein